MGKIAITTRAQQGSDTRRNILRLAVDVASRRGLDALSIGDLAKELGMSKSGLFAHFGSKEDLQIATIVEAEKMFGAAIIQPACEKPVGMASLVALLDGYLNYLEQSIFSGGCFFAAAAAEFDDQPGRVRDRIKLSMQHWADIIENQTRLAVEAGELEASTDTGQLAFELKALGSHANFGRRLMGDEQAVARARQAIYERLRILGTERGREVLRSIESRE